MIGIVFYNSILEWILSFPYSIVNIWIGDSPVRLIAKHYTHFSDKFMREQMDIYAIFSA